jgi:CelD/BcsL family acetyltransferase involved in cellulose biosynthesis
MIYLKDLLTKSESTKLILEFLNNNKSDLIHDQRLIRESVVIDLAGGWTKLRETLPRKFRKNINSQSNKLRKAGYFNVAKYSKPQDLQTAFDCISKISSKSWQGINGTGLLSSQDTEEFYRGLAEFAARAGWLSIWVLYLDGNPIAYEYHLSAGSTEYALKAEYNRDYSELSPGAFLDAFVIRKFSEGLTRKYDLLGYKDSYKTRWSDKTDKYIRLYIFKRNILGKICHFIDFPVRARVRKNALLRATKNTLAKLRMQPLKNV